MPLPINQSAKLQPQTPLSTKQLESSPHGPARIVKHPLILPMVDMLQAICLNEIRDDVRNDASRVVRVLGNSRFCELVQFGGVEDVPTFLRAGVKNVCYRRLQRHGLELALIPSKK